MSTSFGVNRQRTKHLIQNLTTQGERIKHTDVGTQNVTYTVFNFTMYAIVF